MRCNMPDSPTKILRNLLAPLAVMLALCPDAGAQEGATSLNTEIIVVPAPGQVTIDGKSDEWDLSAGVWSYNNPTLVNRYSVWTHMMWDGNGVYFLARFHDRSPMQNATMGKDFSKSWKSDCYQARVVLDDRTADEHQMHINMFYSTPEAKPYMIVKHGGFRAAPPYDETGPDRPDLEKRFGPTMEQAGGKIAVRKWDDGKGYDVEAFWPWSYLRLGGRPLKPGEQFVFGLEAMWGNADGTTAWPEHRLADGIKDEKVNRIFMFRARNGWGRAVISDKGKLDITRQQEELQAKRLKAFLDYDTYGSVPVKYALDEDREVTIAIDDANGLRVRNLFGQYPRKKGRVTDLWDALDDKGKPVPPGSYTAYVVDHRPLELKFVNSLYNAGTPPWPTETAKKLWGSNHGHPTTAAMKGDVMLIGFTGTEGGSGLIRIDPNGIILWSDGEEILDVAIGDKYCYTLSRASWINKTVVRRLTLDKGQLVPFDDEQRSPVAELPVNYGATPTESSIASVAGKLFAMIVGDKLYRIRPATGAVEASFAVADLCAVTSHQDQLVGLFADGTVATLNADGVRGQTILQGKGVTKPVRVTIAGDGRVAVTDRATNRVLVFGADGKPVQAVGAARAEAERPAGKFIETDLANPLGAAFDKDGRLWIAEASKNSKRVTVWSEKGELQKSFWGAADYGAMAAFPVTFDSTRFLAHGVEFQLDPNPDPKTRPTAEKPLIYHPDLANERGIIYRYKGHDYAVTVPGYNNRGTFRIAKRDADGVFRWCARIQRTAGVYWSVGWVRPDMTYIAADCRIFPLKGLSDTGVPLYDEDNPVTPANKISKQDAQGSTGTIVMDDAGNISDGIRFHTVDGRSGAYPNRYGRHDAPAAQRGVLIAPFRTNGVVENVPGVGAITALGGDRGEWFLMTMDGLYISSICQDIKGDVTLDETFIGGESFGGFIWRDEKNRVLVQLGGNSYRLMEVQGLDTCRKTKLPLTVTQEQIDEGAKIAAARRPKAAEEPKELRVARLAKLPAEPVAPDLLAAKPLIEGAADFRVQERGDASRWWRAALAHDGKSLAVMFQVADASAWKNGEGRFTHAFIGGDCVDLKLDIPQAGPVRVLAAPIAGKDIAVLFRKKAQKKDNPTTYAVQNNPANAESFDVVRVLDSAKVVSRTASGGYSVLVTVPLADLGLDASKSGTVKGTVGVIYSDPAGTNRASRLYWFDKETGLVSDVPSEARLDPKRWGPIVFEK